MHNILLTFLTLTLLISANPHASKVELMDKTNLKGEIVYITEAELGLKHFASSKPLRINFRMVKHIETNVERIHKNYAAHILLKNGDSTPATPLSLKNKIWTLDIPHIGKKEIPESSIKSIQFNSSIFRNIYRLNNTVENLSEAWTIDKGILSMNGRGTVTIPSKIDNNIKLSFTLKSKTTPILRFFIGVLGKEDLYRQHCLFLQFTKNNLSLIALQKDKERTLASCKINFTNKEQNLEFNFAIQDGYFSVQANKKQLAKLHAPNVKLKFSGSKIHLMNDQANGQSTQIKNLEILRWHYTAARHLKQMNENTKFAQWVSTSPQSSQITSFDHNTGTFTVTEKGNKTILKTSKLKGISYTNHKTFASPEATLLSTGAKLSLKNIRLQKDGKIRATHPILNEVQFEKKSVMRLQGGFPSLW